MMSDLILDAQRFIGMPDRAEQIRVLIDTGMIVPMLGRDDEAVRWLVTEKGRRILETACDVERAQ